MLLDEVEFTIFDTETTGLDPQEGDRIIEIAAIRFRRDKQVATFESLVNPGRPVSPAAFQVNKISDEMLKGAPAMAVVMPGFLNFIQGSCLCSYNAGFDLEFLDHELMLLGKGKLQDIAVADILKMAKRLIPGLPRYALWFVAEALGIKVAQQHRAFSDVELTLGVFRRLKEIMELKRLSDYRHFLNLFSIDQVFLDNLNNQKISQIQEAIDLGMKLKIKYLSSSGAELTEREVIPKEVLVENKRSYLVGFCCLRNEERTFRIDGILHIEVI